MIILQIRRGPSKAIRIDSFMVDRVLGILMQGPPLLTTAGLSRCKY
jgi:hypothetical protein